MVRWIVVSAAAALAWPASASADIEEIFVGRDSVGRLQVRLEGTLPVELNRSVFPGYPGWAEGHPGIESATLDEPAEDFFVLSTAADLRFILVASDPGIQLLNESGSGPMQVGESYFLGHPVFDVHPFWFINAGQPGVTSSIRILVRDFSGLYTDSEVLDLPFTPAGCYANCDESTAAPALNVADFTCFLQKYAAGDVFANCDASTQAPVLNVADFTCFLQRFAAGCP